MKNAEKTVMNALTIPHVQNAMREICFTRTTFVKNVLRTTLDGNQFVFLALNQMHVPMIAGSRNSVLLNVELTTLT